MVLKTTLCRFSGLRIYPGRGILFIRVDNQQYLFLNKKCKSHFHNRLRPAKLAWTTTYRRAGRPPCLRRRALGDPLWLGLGFGGRRRDAGRGHCSGFGRGPRPAGAQRIRGGVQRSGWRGSRGCQAALAGVAAGS
jgi:large subunit ribosomal protein L24e